MKTKWKIIIPAGLIALALVCTLGWRAMVRQDDPGQVTANPLGAQQSLSAEETPNATPVAMPEVYYTLAPIPSTAPKVTAAPEATGNASDGDTVTVEKDGTIVITPDWQEQIDQASKIVTPDSQVTANMGGGGGDLKLGEDGAFHGTPPTPAPVVSQRPGSIQTPEAPSPAPTVPSEGDTSEPVTTPTPEATPAPTPSQGPQEGNGPPSYNGTYDGQISPDGKYMWYDLGSIASGWIEYHPGAIGEQIDDSDRYAPGTGLTGNKVGEM